MFKGQGKRLQFKKVQLCKCAAEVTSPSCLSPCQPVALAGGNISFWGWNWHYFVRVSFWDHICRLCAVISRTSYSSVDFYVGNRWLCSNRKPVPVIAVHVCGWIPATFNEGWAPESKELFLLPYRQHCLFCPTKGCCSLIHFFPFSDCKKYKWF